MKTCGTIPKSLVVAFMTVCWLQSSLGQTNNQWHLKAGRLKLDVYVSKTAHLFHVVDQISQWSEFCHRQYVSYFENLDGGLNETDRGLLAEHAGIRRKRGWGGGLEQTFYTSLKFEAALTQGIKKGLLTEEEAQIERRVLTHFESRVEQLFSAEAPTLQRFARTLSEQLSDLTAFANTMARFVDCTNLTVPLYLIANPDDASIGGGYNGERLTLEIARNRDVYPSLLHELFHAFMRTKQSLIENAARATPGLDSETLNEGLAYAYSPGIVHAKESDVLLATVAHYAGQGSFLQDSYTRFNFYGLALRPLLKEALSDSGQTLETLVPRATDAWLVLAELDKARGRQPASQAHDYRKDLRHSMFIFGIWEPEVYKQDNRHCFGRSHAAAQYEEMLTKNAKPGDTIVLLLSLDDNHARVPAEFSDLLTALWNEIENRLKKGETVFQQGKARDMTVFLLATPTLEELRKEFRRLVSGKKFSL